MNYATIKYCDIANGIGVRTTLFVSGCRRACPFCFNPEAWSFEYGNPFDEAVQQQIIDSLKPDYIQGLTLLGGEPFEPANQRGLVDFLERVRHECPCKTIWSYSGFTWEEIMGEDAPHPPYDRLGISPVTEVTERFVSCLDVLVDGPFVQAKKDITLRFRGSSNQRLIDVPATLAARKTDPARPLIPWKDEPLFSTHTM